MIKKYSDLIVLFILWIISIISIIIMIADSYVIGLPNYLGLGLLLVCTILWIIKIKKIKTIISLMLILGTANVIQFTASSFVLTLSWTPMGTELFTFGLQPLSFGLLLFLVIFNFSDVIKLYYWIKS